MAKTYKTWGELVKAWQKGERGDFEAKYTIET